MPALSTWTPEDEVLAAVAPLMLAYAAGTALVIDLDPNGPPYPGSGSLASLVDEGPRRVDLSPARAGVAVLRNGGIDVASSRSVVMAIASGWPHVVLRLDPRREPPEDVAAPVVPVRLLSPLVSSTTGPAVYQAGPWRIRPPGTGLVVPRPRAGTVEDLLLGRSPGRGRWVKAWRRVWEAPWE